MTAREFSTLSLALAIACIVSLSISFWVDEAPIRKLQATAIKVEPVKIDTLTLYMSDDIYYVSGLTITFEESPDVLKFKNKKDLNNFLEKASLKGNTLRDNVLSLEYLCSRGTIYGAVSIVNGQPVMGLYYQEEDQEYPLHIFQEMEQIYNPRQKETRYEFYTLPEEYNGY